VVARRRRADDLEELTRMAEAVRGLDGYPPRSPDLFVGPEVLAAWVAVDEGIVVGHVALHRTSADPVMTLASEATGWAAGRLVVVARLLVAPTSRRRGAGRLLIDHAVAEAHTRDRWPVLDVATHFHPAIALYESCGWTCAGPVTFVFRDGTTMREADSLVYVGPRPGRSEPA
jgi:GNAT superfamily N-acetyltransferase